jgi:hypothetical protein
MGIYIILSLIVCGFSPRLKLCKLSGNRRLGQLFSMMVNSPLYHLNLVESSIDHGHNQVLDFIDRISQSRKDLIGYSRTGREAELLEVSEAGVYCDVLLGEFISDARAAVAVTLAKIAKGQINRVHHPFVRAVKQVALEISELIVFVYKRCFKWFF